MAGGNTTVFFTADDALVFVLVEPISLPLAYSGWDHLLSGNWIPGLIGVLIGVPLSILAASYHWWKPWLSDSGRLWLWTTAERWWPISFLLVFVYVCGPSILGNRDLDKRLSTVETDLKHYVLPRHLTDKQKHRLVRYLKNHPPGTVSIVYVAGQGAIENSEYASSFQQPIKDGNWKVTDVHPIDDVTLDKMGLPWAESVYICEGNDANKAMGDTLIEAFKAAKIPLNGNNSNSPTVMLIFAHRFSVYYPPSINVDIPDKSYED